jgi:gliding motility-associated-like protein
MYQEFSITEQTQIFVIITDTNGCTGQASLLVDVEAEYRVYIPNVFTPNNDGPNDMFTIFANEEVEEVVILQIFDRWGNMVFENQEFPPNEPNYGWDGIYKGKMMNPDVFAYRAVVKYSNGELHPFKGDVTLIR